MYILPLIRYNLVGKATLEGYTVLHFYRFIGLITDKYLKFIDTADLFQYKDILSLWEFLL